MSSPLNKSPSQKLVPEYVSLNPTNLITRSHQLPLLCPPFPLFHHTTHPVLNTAKICNTRHANDVIHFPTFALTLLALHRVRGFFLLRFRWALSFLFGLLNFYPKMSFCQHLSSTKRCAPTSASTSRRRQVLTMINICSPLSTKKTKVHCCTALPKSSPQSESI